MDILKLPPRKIWVFGLGLVAIVIVIRFLLYPQTTYENIGNINHLDDSSEVIHALKEGISDSDKDRDGLRDWEEVLWKTDPENSDTDGDGLSDGEEIDQNRDPLVKGPNDKRVESVDTSAEKTVSEPKTATEVFSQQFFADYMFLRQSGKLNDPDSQDILFRSAENVLLGEEKPKYDKKDIIIVKESPDTIRQFGNQTGAVLKIYGDTGDEKALLIVEKAVSDNDKDYIERLGPIIESYDNTAEHLLAVPVPENAASIHLDFINNISVLHDTLLNLKNVFTDPLQALVSLEKYNTGLEKTSKSLKNLELYFKQKNITFTKNEDGYLITNLPF